MTLLDADGFATPSIRHAPLADVDIADARIRSCGLTLPPALARYRLKEWQHYLFTSPEALVMVAVVDAKFTSVSWTQVIDLTTGEQFEHRHQRPGGTPVARALWNERTTFSTSGYDVDIHSHLERGEYLVDARAQASRHAPEMAISLRAEHDVDAVQSMVVSMPVGRRRCAYSHKVPLPASGEVRVGERTYVFDRATSLAVLDIHKAHYPRRTFWRWATFAGRLADGRIASVNLTKNVVQDDATWNENAAWVGGRVQRLGPAVFDFDRAKPEKAWTIASADDAVHLRFEPRGLRGENVNIPGVARSRFKQFYGAFSGTIRTADESVSFAEWYGLCEDHDSIW